jgi:hypothetical protein
MLEVGPVLGGLRFVELALFEWLGRVAVTLADDDEVVWASAGSLRAAWRALQLEALLPVSVGLPNATSTTAPGPLVAGAVAQLDVGDVPETASSWYEVLLVAYRQRLAWTAPAADAPLERMLTRVVTDLEAEQTTVQRASERPGRNA